MNKTLAQKLERIKELKAQKLALLTANRKYEKENQLEFFGREGSTLQPNPVQAKILDAWLNPKIKICLMTGANQIGKTTIATVIALSVMFKECLWDGTDLSYLIPHNKAIRVRYVGQSWQDHIKKVVLPELYKWWPKNRKVETSSNGVIRDTFWKDVKTGSTLEIMSNLQDSDVHEGAKFDLVIFDEPPKRDIWVANARGLIARQGRALFTMTLLKEAWVHHEIIKRMLPNGRPDRSVFAVDADISVNIGYGLTEEGVEEFAKNLTEEEKEARLRGKPSYLSGLVCKHFDLHTHVVDRFKIPTDWVVDIAIDIHPRKEQAVLFIATDPKNERYLCYEIWEHGDGPQTADKIIRIIQYNALRVNRIIIDPLAKGDANNENTTYDKIEQVLARHGYILETATKDKSSGIIEINNHLKGANNKPSLFVFHDLVVTKKQIGGWIYDDNGKPAKVDDDMPENLYRLLLLDTQYVAPEDEEDEEVFDDNYKADGTTGY